MTPTKFTTTTLTAENTFTPWMQLDRGQAAAVSMFGGTFTSTTKVTLQRRYNPGGDIRQVSQYTAATEIDYIAPCGMEIRLGIKTGDFTTSDSVTVEMKTG